MAKNASKISYYVAKKAFSLIEMLMALLVASLLMAAIAPVVTKKFEQKINIGSVSSDIPGNPVVERKVCVFGPMNNENGTGDAEQTCTAELNGLSYTTAYAIIVSGGGGGAGAVDEKVSGDITKSYTTAGSETLYFNPSIKSMKVKLFSGGGGGGGGNLGTGGNSFEPSVQNCKNISGTDTSGHTASSTAPIAIYNNNSTTPLCITAYNQQAPSDYVKDLSQYDPIALALDDKLPLYKYLRDTNNERYTSDEQDINDYPYQILCINIGVTKSDGTTELRPACTYDAAVLACRNLSSSTGKKWRLPTQNELLTVSGNTLVKDLKLCHNSNSSYTGYECGVINGTALYAHWSTDPQTSNLQCRQIDDAIGGDPYTIAFSAPSFLRVNYAILNSGFGCRYRWNSGNKYYSSYFSTRCVLAKQTDIVSYKGGGGAGGMYAKIDVPASVLEYLAKNNKVGKLVLNIGEGGNGGTKGNNGGNGGATSAEIYDGPNRLWFIEIPGGNGGSKAENRNGAGGTANTSHCKYYIAAVVNNGIAVENTNGTIACNRIPGLEAYAGGNGESGDERGVGGASKWVTTDTAARHGNGGNSGACPEGAENLNSCTSSTQGANGSNGSAGGAYITYQTRVPGIGGSGGGAGGFARVKFAYNSGDTVKAIVGRGGQGGSPSGAGSDGGNSLLKLNDTILYEVEGGKGGKRSTQGELPADGSGDNNLVGDLTVPLSGEPGEGGKLITGTSDLNEPSNVQGNAGIRAILPMINSVVNRYSLYSNGGSGSINEVFKRSAKYPACDSSRYNCSSESGQADFMQGLVKGGDGENGNNDANAYSIDSSLYNGHLNTFENTASDYNDAAIFYRRYLMNHTYMFDAAGSGGGGGGWKYNSNGNNLVGSGANGQDGYVFIYFGIDDN